MKNPEASDSTANHDEPEVFAIKREGSLWRMSKRGFLQAAALGAVSASAACAHGDEDDDEPDAGGEPENSIPPFALEGVTYRIVNLVDYNHSLPSDGSNTVVIGYVGSDFYFRRFDEQGRINVNVHESKISDRTKLSELKELTSQVVTRGRAEPAEHARIARLFSDVTTATGLDESPTGKRMQGTEARVESTERRLQGSVGHGGGGSPSGRRFPGSEGRVEPGAKPRNLGTVIVNGEKYENTTIVEAYTDGYCKVGHSGGSVVLRTDALPEIVQMQTPLAIPNPSPKPSAIPAPAPAVTRPAPPVAPRPAPRPTPQPGRQIIGHYWRPN